MDTIKIAIFDFDGVFTDGRCYFDLNSKIQKYYNIKDGMGLKYLKDNGIRTGLISSYSTEKEVYLNENRINEEIIAHLNFDYTFIGKSNKIDILRNWLDELKLDISNVAYIGDDINDVEIMKHAGFSACPCDAVSECKETVDYICDNKGGGGCVREFANEIVEIVRGNKKKITIIREIKNEFMHQIDNFNLEEIGGLCEMIGTSKGNIYFCGVGKSGNIAKYCCDLLKCVSVPAFHLDILNLVHGDIGTLTNKDIVLMFSNSGNTRELVDIIPLLNNMDVKTIGVCSNVKSKFNELCNTTIITPFKNEIRGEIDKIPTNSCMSHLIFSNILVSLLKKNISVDKYTQNHLAGNIGKQLLKIKNVLVVNFPKIILSNSADVNIHGVLLEMTRYKIGCCFFVDSADNLLGILTDGDIRRLMLTNDFELVNIDNINTNYWHLTDCEIYVCELDNYNYIPILENKKIIGIVDKGQLTKVQF